MSTLEVWWFAVGDAAPTGPLTEDQLRALIAAGSLPPKAQVWSTAGRIWPEGAKHPSRGRRRGAASVGADVALGFVVLLATALAWALFAADTDLMAVDGTSRIRPQDVILVWPAVGGGLAAATILAAVLWWRWASRPRRGSELAAVIKVSAVLLTLAGLVLAGLELRLTDFAARTAEATANWSATIHADPAHNRLSIVGDVGPRFGARVVTELARLKDPVTVEITSPGGLLKEALIVARALQARPGSTVIVREGCASACLIVLMGADHRLADPDAELDFHAGASAAKTQSRFIGWANQKEIVKADDYLRERGVPSVVIDGKNRIGPAHVYPVTVSEALRLGILTGVAPPPTPPPAVTSPRRGSPGRTD